MSHRLALWIERFGERSVVIAIAILAFILQLVTMRAPEIYGEPYLVAKNILAGKGFVFAYPLCKEAVTCYVTPLYVFVQVPILWLGLGERGVQIFNLLTLLAACLVLYRFFRRFTRPWVGVLLFAALSFYVPFWILADALDPNALNILLIALTVDCLYRLDEHPRTSDWILLGMYTGLQLLVRPDILMGSCFFALWLIWRRSQWSTVRGMMIAGMIAVVIVVPWTIRNYLAFDRFVLVSANSGYNLYIGNNDVATGEFSALPATPASEQAERAIAAYAQSHNAVDVDRYRFKMAEQWMITHPALLITLDLKKIYFHWFGRSLIGNLYHFGDGTFWTAYFILSVVLIALSGLALYQLHDKRLRSLLTVVFLYSTAVSALFFVQSRHRALKVDPFMVPLAVIAIAGFVREPHEVKNEKISLAL